MNYTNWRADNENGTPKNYLAWCAERGIRPDFSGAYLVDANFLGANLVDANLAGANLAGAYLAGAYLERANLEGANLEGAVMRGAILERANLEGANMRYAGLRGADMEYANLEHADMRGADMRGAILRGANLVDANLAGANLAGADIDCALNMTSYKGDIAFKILGGVFNLKAGCFTAPVPEFINESSAHEKLNKRQKAQILARALSLALGSTAEDSEPFAIRNDIMALRDALDNALSACLDGE